MAANSEDFSLRSAVVAGQVGISVAQKDGECVVAVVDGRSDVVEIDSTAAQGHLYLVDLCRNFEVD